MPEMGKNIRPGLDGWHKLVPLWLADGQSELEPCASCSAASSVQWPGCATRKLQVPSVIPCDTTAGCLIH